MHHLQRILSEVLMAAVVWSAGAGSAWAGKFGKTAAGEAVETYTLKNAGGMVARLMTRGATLIEWNVPDKNGKLANVVLGFDDLAGYESERNQYFGCIVGRVANRIAGATFTLGGQTYNLAKNDGPNSLHGGGKRSLDKVLWKAEPFTQNAVRGIRFSYTSPDGEEGYPGTLKIQVAYTLTDKNELRIDYTAQTDKDTPVNLSHHSYFNLAGAGADSILDHEVEIKASKYTPMDEKLIPTGKVAPVRGTPLDFTKPMLIGARIKELIDTPAKGYDHNFVLAKGTGALVQAARVRHPATGRILTVHTDQPGLQFYSGNFLFGQKGKDGKVYRPRSAFCMETQHFPDAVHHPSFPSIILRTGQTYRHSCVYVFSTE